MQLDDINTITVLGAGTMGHGIAEVAALAGYDVRMRDVSEELVTKGYDQIEWSLGKLVEHGQLSAEESEAALERVTPVVDVADAVDDVEFVIEAVPERMEIKRAVFEEVEANAPADAIFTSNTSSLSISEIASVTDREERFCGMHFFNPPVRMELVEIIAGAETNEETLDVTEELAEAFGKTSVRVHSDSPGFIVNRILIPMLNEASWIVESDDATIAEVDSTAKFDVGLPMGAFELADHVGIDVGYHVLEYIYDELGEAYEPCPLLVEKVEAGDLGKKTGQGFYDYENGGATIPTDAGAERIAHRLLAVMANETAQLLGEGVADLESIETAITLGLRFPEGPARLADDAGLNALVECLDELHEETGEQRYEVADYLRERAAEGGFYEHIEDDGTDFETIRIEYPGEWVGHVILDRPHRMNAVSDRLLDELSQAVDLLEADDEVRTILLTGEGGRAFSAGADITSMAAGGADPIAGVELSRTGQRAFGKLEACDLPVVAGIDGYCLGGGMELATCADLRIASEKSTFGQTEFSLGLLPAWGGTQRLRHLVGEARAKEIIFTAEQFDAETMERYGFLVDVVPDGELEDAALELATKLASGPPIAHKLTKRAMLAGRDDTDAGLAVESQAFGILMGTDDMMEGVSAFISDRDPEFEGK